MMDMNKADEVLTVNFSKIKYTHNPFGTMIFDTSMTRPPYTGPILCEGRAERRAVCHAVLHRTSHDVCTARRRVH